MIKKNNVLSFITIIVFVVLVIGATFAYFQTQGNTSSTADIKVTTYTTDLLTFETGGKIAIYADQSNFGVGKGNQSGVTFTKATLSANSKTNVAQDNYYVYFYIADNSFVYTQENKTAELLLQVTDPDGDIIQSLPELEYKTVIDGDGNQVSGFDITTKLGMFTLVDNHEINAAPYIEETWNIQVLFVNLDANQTLNTGMSFNGQIIITKDNYENYTPAMVHTINTDINDTNLTVHVNASEGTAGINKYYFALKENNTIAYDSLKVTKLANQLLVGNLEYIETDSNTYTFTNIDKNSNYEVFTYVVDNKKTSSNIYQAKISNDVYILPSITSVDVTSKTDDSITISTVASIGTNTINKYFYSIDNGDTYIESSDSTYTFTNLVKWTSYNIKVKVSDTDNKYSHIFEKVEKTGISLASWVKEKYTGIQGENSLYYHDSSLANGAGDNSYRYAGASESVNNFVCFGSDEETCPDDNLYRIIGVFGDQVKLIKWDYATKTLLGENGDYKNDYQTLSSGYWGTSKGSNSLTEIGAYWWNYDGTTNGTNIWNNSKLNNINLNKNFLANLGSFADKIALSNWQVGGNTYQKLYGYNTTQTASSAYQYEIVEPAKNVIVSQKVGLMYVSDYYYGALPIHWEKAGASTSGEENDYRSAIEENWFYMGLYEWLLTPYSADNNQAFALLPDGCVGQGNVGGETDALTIRPVFYLNANVLYILGDGSKNNPVRID